MLGEIKVVQTDSSNEECTAVAVMHQIRNDMLDVIRCEPSKCQCGQEKYQYVNVSSQEANL